jgi:hypothetical protein
VALLSIANAMQEKISLQEMFTTHPLEFLDPYLREHLSYFFTQAPCKKQLPGIFWPPMHFPSDEQKKLLLEWSHANRFVNECHNAAPAHLLRTELEMIPNGSIAPRTECGWGSNHEDLGPRASKNQSKYKQHVSATAT